MEKGLVTLLLLCCVGFLVTSSSAQFPSAEEKQTALEVLQQTLEEAQENDNGFPQDEDDFSEIEKSTSSGVVYTHWGQESCPSTSTRIYFGRAGGGHYNHVGAGTNYICLPHNPEYYSSSHIGKYPAYVYGAEYETYGGDLRSLQNHNVPCAVCYAKRQAMLMIPAKINCPSKWTKEYNGYLMASYYGHASPKNFVCMDKNAEPARGEAGNTDGALFYHARTANCHGLDCPPYTVHKDLACVVCTQ